MWKTMADMVQVFQFDETLKQELSSVTNKRIADRTCEFLDAVTQEFSEAVFKVLKLTYIPMMVMRLQTADIDDQVRIECVE